MMLHAPRKSIAWVSCLCSHASTHISHSSHTLESDVQATDASVASSSSAPECGLWSLEQLAELMTKMLGVIEEANKPVPSGRQPSVPAFFKNILEPSRILRQDHFVLPYSMVLCVCVCVDVFIMICFTQLL